MKLSPVITVLIALHVSIPVGLATQYHQPHDDLDSEVDDLPDFNFEKTSTVADFSEPEEFIYPEDEIVKLDDVEVTAGDHRINFINRERKIRQVLTAALTNAQMRRKFSEVIPMLRLMTKAQRLTLAALIQAQVAGDQELTLEQVSNKLYTIH